MGGHLNNEFFWEGLTPLGINGMQSFLNKAVNLSFGSPQDMILSFMRAIDENPGPGYAWLVLNKMERNLEVKVTPDHDLLQSHHPDVVPLLNIDLCEHAYFIDYENSREKYLKEIWKIINWVKVAQRYDKALKY